METTTTFVLGILCGSFLLGIVYGVIGMLKMKKSQKQLLATVNTLEIDRDDLHRRIDQTIDGYVDYHSEQQRNLNTRFESILRDLEQHRQDEVRRTNDDYQGLRKLLDGTNRYVDKRVDHATTTSVQYTDSKIENTVDVLCTRMDMLLNDGLKAYHGIKEDELLKS